MRTTFTTFALAALLVLLCGIFLWSCQSRLLLGPHGDPILTRNAIAYVEAYSSNDGPSMVHVEGSTPCLVGAIVDFLNDFKPGTTKVFTKIEIDFGDGSGWQDVTAQQHSWDYYTYDGIDQSSAVLHTYTQPGKFRVRSRVSYWDGEVVESMQANGEEPLVTVTQ